MYSTNGRIKPDKETASENKHKAYVELYCPECGFEQEVAKVFGETAMCPHCGSVLVER